jgi:hypothetical protein
MRKMVNAVDWFVGETNARGLCDRSKLHIMKGLKTRCGLDPRNFQGVINRHRDVSFVRSLEFTACKRCLKGLTDE